MKIFAIDDEKASLYYLTKEIRELLPNAEIKAFNSQENFLEEFRHNPPDIVFIDIEMPEISGIELAKKIIEIKKDINIIFATAYTKYALDALNIYASGYILKPTTKKDVEKVLSNLRYPVIEKRIRAKTFGNFDLFVNDNSVKFRLTKSKELLAYLIDREGSKLTRKEVASILYEDKDYTREVQKDLCRVAQWLNEDLVKAGAEGVFINDDGYRVDVNKFECDLYEYLKGNKEIKYLGEYMEQYEFAEERKGILLEIK